jgi:hypothetical protein
MSQNELRNKGLDRVPSKKKDSSINKQTSASTMTPANNTSFKSSKSNAITLDENHNTKEQTNIIVSNLFI